MGPQGETSLRPTPVPFKERLVEAMIAAAICEYRSDSMPLNEYPSGTPLPGVVGRTAAEGWVC